MNRRSILKYAGFTAVGMVAGARAGFAETLRSREPKLHGRPCFRLNNMLSCARDTEAPNSSPLLDEHRNGIFACAGCDLPLYHRIQI